ncbi:LysR family transcriptional regulator [Dongia sp. agr-C8]
MSNYRDLNNLPAMVAFAIAVDRGSLTAAGKALGRSKAAISRQIAELEERLGVQLLQRTTRAIAPTPAGKEFHSRCATIIEGYLEAQSEVTALDSKPKGMLRATLPLAFTVLQLGELVPRMLEQMPELRLDVMLSDRKVDLLEEGFDVALRLGDPMDESLVALHLGDCKLLVCGAPRYLKAHGIPTKPSDLAKHECIIETSDDSNAVWMFGKGRAIKVNGRLRTNNGQMARAAAVAGQGLAFLPSFLVHDDVKAGRLRPLLTEYLDALYPIYAVFPQNRRSSAKVRAFVDLLRETLKTGGWLHR